MFHLKSVRKHYHESTDLQYFIENFFLLHRIQHNENRRMHHYDKLILVINVNQPSYTVHHYKSLCFQTQLKKEHFNISSIGSISRQNNCCNNSPSSKMGHLLLNFCLFRRRSRTERPSKVNFPWSSGPGVSQSSTF